MSRSDSSLAAVLLTQRLVDGPAEPLKASEYWTLVERVEHLDDLLGRSGDQLADDLGLEPDLAARVASRIDQATQVAFEIDNAEQRGLRVVASVDGDYPAVLVERLGRAAPPLLYVAGEPALLRDGGLGIVGTNDASPRAAEVVTAVAVKAADEGIAIVTGGANDVDAGGGCGVGVGVRVVGVLADPLTQAVREPDVRRMITAGALCLCTPYNPSARYSAVNANGRNKIIYALATATLVVAAEPDRGDAWAGAVEALSQSYTSSPVLVWTGEGAGRGNRALVERGGIPIDRVADVFPLDRHSAPDEQLTLEL